MTEIERLLDQFRRAYNGDSWAGPSLTATLQGVTAAQAASHPLAGAHSIWEIILHLETWIRTVYRRIEQNKLLGPTDAENWPSLPEATDEGAWQQAQARLGQAHEQLLARISHLRDADLSRELEPVPDYPAGTPGPYYVLLHGLVQHHLYHTGQIALLRKAFA
ncbi:DinB family protein [Hymenobacter crusticola]|uniref:DinB-like domain-containing protein n=1 Tax=Hymenobacter crusticola TaxID=1770526 RepID=A0A243WIX8_9BACT|nr:DinB family protein [Hymenobacter crusticola]OUJ75230.1 hypothetical protein BXP70_04175 [Hymenobacter crusticola]